MTPAARQWRTDRIADWRARAALTRRIGCGRREEETIAAALDRACDRLQAELDDTPLAAPALSGIARAAPFSPWAGTKADQHRASAAVCRKIGYPEIAAGYEKLADQWEAEHGSETPAPAEPPPAVHPIHYPPCPDPVPFTAGPQIDMFA